MKAGAGADDICRRFRCHGGDPWDPDRRHEGDPEDAATYT